MRVLLAVLLLSAVAVAEDKPATLKEVKSAAEGGDKDAQYRLGEWYRVTFHDDDAEALKWYRKAAEQGHAEAQYHLGVMYGTRVDGIRKNVAEAMKWYRKAAEQGHAIAQRNLGFIYARGEFVRFSFTASVPKDVAEAAKWHRKAIKSFRKAAEQGHAESQFYLGRMYDNGNGTPQNYAEALKWYRKAAEQGNADAQINLGDMYERGKGVPKDRAAAVKLYRKAAEQGHAIAQWTVGKRSYEDGKEAYAWYSVAEENGYDGYNERLGQTEAERQMIHLEKYYTPDQITAAEKLAAAYCHRYTSKYDAEGVKWIREAAEQGYIPAQHKLGLIYANGQGVPGDNVEAYAWMSVAATNGHRGTGGFSKAKAKLTTDQLAAAQKRATELFEQINATKAK